MSKCKLQRHILNTVRSVELYYEKFSVQPRTPTNVMYRLNGIEGGYTRTVPGEVRGYKLVFVMLDSTEHDINFAHECGNANNNCWHFNILAG